MVTKLTKHGPNIRAPNLSSVFGGVGVMTGNVAGVGTVTLSKTLKSL